MNLLDKVTKALEGKSRDKNRTVESGGSVIRAAHLVELLPKDILALCALVPPDKRSQVIQDLERGSTNATAPSVLIEAADAFELLDAATPSQDVSSSERADSAH